MFHPCAGWKLQRFSNLPGYCVKLHFFGLSAKENVNNSELFAEFLEKADLA